MIAPSSRLGLWTQAKRLEVEFTCDSHDPRVTISCESLHSASDGVAIVLIVTARSRRRSMRRG